MLVTPYPDPMLMVVCMCVFGDSLACFEMGEYETAKAAFEQALKAPTTHASLQAPLRKWLRKCQAEIECTPLVGGKNNWCRPLTTVVSFRRRRRQ